MKTKNVPNQFLFLANPSRNGSALACSAADSSAARRRKGVNPELFRNWLSQHGVPALNIELELL